jgi:hypothetical protein
VSSRGSSVPLAVVPGDSLTVEAWTGGAASALQAALRLTNEAYAERLGLAVRTIAKWHSRPETQLSRLSNQLLDIALRSAPADARSRFASTWTAELASVDSADVHAQLATLRAEVARLSSLLAEVA